MKRVQKYQEKCWKCTFPGNPWDMRNVISCELSIRLEFEDIACSKLFSSSICWDDGVSDAVGAFGKMFVRKLWKARDDGIMIIVVSWKSINGEKAFIFSSLSVWILVSNSSIGLIRSKRAMNQLH